RRRGGRYWRTNSSDRPHHQDRGYCRFGHGNFHRLGSLISRSADCVCTHPRPEGHPVSLWRIAKIGKTPIQVTDVKCWPRVFAAAKDHSIRSIAEAAIGRAPLALIAPGEDWDFTLIIPSGIDFDALRTAHFSC